MVAVLQCGPDGYPVALPSLGDRGAHSNRETSKPVIPSFSEPDRHICSPDGQEKATTCIPQITCKGDDAESGRRYKGTKARQWLLLLMPGVIEFPFLSQVYWLISQSFQTPILYLTPWVR